MALPKACLYSPLLIPSNRTKSDSISAAGSQIGAWASSQSATLISVDELQQRVREHEKKFADQPITLPPFWGGFRVIPQRIEFWQGRANRLHDRLCYERVNNDWLCRRLYP